MPLVQDLKRRQEQIPTVSLQNCLAGIDTFSQSSNAGECKLISPHSLFLLIICSIFTNKDYFTVLMANHGTGPNGREHGARHRINTEKQDSPTPMSGKVQRIQINIHCFWMPVRDTFQVFSGSTTTIDVAKENHDLNRERRRLLKTHTSWQNRNRLNKPLEEICI